MLTVENKNDKVMNFFLVKKMSWIFLTAKLVNSLHAPLDSICTCGQL